MYVHMYMHMYMYDVTLFAGPQKWSVYQEYLTSWPRPLQAVSRSAAVIVKSCRQRFAAGGGTLVYSNQTTKHKYVSKMHLHIYMYCIMCTCTGS